VSEAAVKSHVFISYSRTDVGFAKRLVEALKRRGFEAFRDETDIAPGEDWKDRLGKLIAAADSVVFLLSPESIKSEICDWEINEAERLTKRILPAVCRPVVAAEVPGRLARLNWIDFSDAARFDAALASLEAALITDISWLRELTRLVGLAEHWERGGRDPAQLMSQADIKATGQLLAMRPQNADLPPQSLSDFLETSRAGLEEDIRKLRRTTGRAFVKPALQALHEGRAENALRAAVAAGILSADLDLNLVPDIASPFAQSAYDNRTSAILKGHTNAVGVASFSPDGRRIVTSSPDATARVWDADSGAEIVCLSAHKVYVRSASFSPDGRRIVTACSDAARVWDAESGEEISCLKAHTDKVWSASFSPDGKRIVTASSDTTARVWDAGSGAEIACLNAHTMRVNSASFSPDGKRIVTASDDTTARVWDVMSWKEITCLDAHTMGVNSASFSPDGRRIVTASNDITARVWNAGSGAEIACLNGHADFVLSASFSPDGRRIVSSSSDYTARVWDVMSWKEITCLDAHTSYVNSASFSPDGQRIVTASSDNTARVWDAGSGAEIACLNAHAGTVLSASFSPDGRRIVTGSGDHRVRVWDVSRTEAIAREPAIVMTAALARGIGWRTEAEAADLLMGRAGGFLCRRAGATARFGEIWR
jgi:WD40 repeat protein